MRPAGEVRQALLEACSELATPDQAPTLKELAAKACVGLDAARRTISNLQRAKLLHSPRPRRVSYRNRPVAEWAPGPAPVPCQAGPELAVALQAWGG